MASRGAAIVPCQNSERVVIDRQSLCTFCPRLEQPSCPTTPETVPMFTYSVPYNCGLLSVLTSLQLVSLVHAICIIPTANGANAECPFLRRCRGQYCFILRHFSG
jgi:hypothetical protein